MRNLLPRSLIGQMALLIGLALLVAQFANFALVLNERQKLSLAQNEGPAIGRFVSTAADLVQAPPEFRYAVLEDASRRGARFSLAPQSSIAGEDVRDADVETRARDMLAEGKVHVQDVRAAFKIEHRAGRRRSGDVEVRVLLLSSRLNGGGWLNGRLVTPRPDPLLTVRLILATLLLYLIVLGATLFVAARIARPLGHLTRAAEDFAGRSEPAPVEPRGPSDLRRAIEAFNAMNRRVLSLLDEKDRMLGAIGHDLRTPLASLRIRVEGVEPETERERMIATIDEMAAMLEDMLVLARSGRAREPERTIDVTALADALVEEYRERGQPVTMLVSAREVADVQPNLLRRAIRNLIDNGVKYAGSASLDVRAENDRLLIEVSDSGPGLPAREIDQILEPFHRLETSRNRETGGSGLGLAIAKAIAEGHGGTLMLANRASGGLSATLSFPRRRAA